MVDNWDTSLNHCDMHAGYGESCHMRQKRETQP